jgi:menaquinone-specific isochorismate synthase
VTPQVAAALATRAPGDPSWSLESGLAVAARGRGVMFVAMPAPIAPVAALLAAWPANAPAVAWSNAGLALVGLGVACELRGTGEARWAEVVAAARRIEAGGAVVGGATMPPAALGFARPRFVGGAAFAPGTADRAPWIGFGDAWFALPRWTYVHDGVHAWLVLAVTPGEAREPSRWAGEHAMLRAAIDAPARVRPQAPMRDAQRGDAAQWRAQVTDITDAIARGEFAKIVAARMCVVTLDDDARAADLLAALDERQPECARVLVRPPGGGALIAATPERLVRRDGEQVACDALAGTIERGPDSASAALRASGKDRREHDLVVRAIADALAAAGADVAIPDEPGVRALRHVLHLHTPIRATLREPRHLLELAARLHPTPAVGGTPTADAVEWIAAHEPAPRGWYASPVGWFDLDGNGELAVAIRSGVLAGPRVHLWAGAGIVAGSDPDRELAETDVKLRAMLGALGAPA